MKNFKRLPSSFHRRQHHDAVQLECPSPEIMHHVQPEKNAPWWLDIRQ